MLEDQKFVLLKRLAIIDWSLFSSGGNELQLSETLKFRKASDIVFEQWEFIYLILENDTLSKDNAELVEKLSLPVQTFRANWELYPEFKVSDSRTLKTEIESVIRSADLFYSRSISTALRLNGRHSDFSSLPSDFVLNELLFSCTCPDPDYLHKTLTRSKNGL